MLSADETAGAEGSTADASPEAFDPPPRPAPAASEGAPAPAGTAPGASGSGALTAEAAGDEQSSPAGDSGEAVAKTPSESGRLGKIKERVVEKVGTTVQNVTEMESVQKGMQFVADKSKKVAENERVQKGIGMVQDTAKVVSEKTAQGIEAAKEKSKALKEGAGAVWQRGRGSISKARASVGKMAWRGSARETLDIGAREEMWKDIRVQGAEELVVAARTEHTTAYHVSKGSTLRWTFRVKDHDIGFGVRMRVQEWGGSREDPVLEVERYESTDTISGSWVADEDRTIILAFDNRYSKLRSKTVAYIVGTEKPPAYTEQSPETSPAAAASTPQASAEAVKPII